MRGHERRMREYRKQYLEILYSASYPDGQPKGNRTSTPTEDRAGRLMQLEASPEAARIRAVEDAVREIGGDIPDEKVRKRLAKAILLNCSSGQGTIRSSCSISPSSAGWISTADGGGFSSAWRQTSIYKGERPFRSCRAKATCWLQLLRNTSSSLLYPPLPIWTEGDGNRGLKRPVQKAAHRG